MKNVLLLFTVILTIGLSSCSKSNELDVTNDEVQLLQNYVEEANGLINVAGKIDGDVSILFNAPSTTHNCTEETSTTSSLDPEARELLNQMVEKMGFESALAIHSWMVDTGRAIYEIKQVNRKNFDSDREMMTELACLVAPEIMTRSNTTQCYKDNLVYLFIRTLDAGSKYGTKSANHDLKNITEAGCSARGSSFHKIWLFMKNSYDCE